jgi:uroporphyrinogen decarboxylase
MNLLLESFKKKTKTPPIWFMRQAGRYLPEYQKVRKKFPNFMEFCNSTPEIVEVTLQPIDRFNLDAAIIFSDILVIPKAIGYKVEFLENHGPIISGSASKKSAELREELSNTYESISLTRKELHKDKSLIGFAGAPWTLACYIFNDKKSKDYYNVKRLAYNKAPEFTDIFEVLKVKVYEHLKNQIESGANCVKIFDSMAGNLDSMFFQELSAQPIYEICTKLKKDHPNIPIIVFPKDKANHALGFEPDCLAISYSENMSKIMQDLDTNITLQGNLDPLYLELKDKDLIKQEVYKILRLMKNRKHIFNLGHGINPTARIENIEYVIDIIRGYKGE